MNAARKIIGLLIILFIGLPILFGIIWAVGLTRAAMSPQVLSDLPQEIVSEMPRILDQVFEEAQDPDVISDPNVRSWFQAASRTGISPRDVMRESGLLDWMENEISGSFRDLGDMLRGERRLNPISIDLRPLRRALSHPAVDRYLIEIARNLPPCDADQLEEWIEAIDRDVDWFDLPACSPDPALLGRVVDAARWHALEDMDDEIEILDNPRFPRGLHRLGLTRFIRILSYGLFLLPILILGLAALIAGGSTGGFFRWFGVPVLLGGLSALALAFLARQAAWWGLSAVSWHPEVDISDLQALLLEKTAPIQDMIVGDLFSPVISLAGVVCIIGFLFFVLSFLFPRRHAVAAAAPPAPVKPATPAAPEPTKVEPVTTDAKRDEEPPQSTS